MSSHAVTRSLPILLLLMAVAVLLILSGAATTGFVFGLVVVGIAGILLGAMFLHEGLQGEARGRVNDRRLHRGPHASGF